MRVSKLSLACLEAHPDRLRILRGQTRKRRVQELKTYPRRAGRHLSVFIPMGVLGKSAPAQQRRVGAR